MKQENNRPVSFKASETGQREGIKKVPPITDSTGNSLEINSSKDTASEGELQSTKTPNNPKRVSLWNDVRPDQNNPPIGGVGPDYNLSYFQLFEGIRGHETKYIDGNELVVISRFIREAEYQSDEYKAAKKRLPWFTPHGCFTGRKNKKIVSHSQVICLDIDKQGNESLPKNIRRTIEGEPHVAGCFESGNGIKVFIPVIADCSTASKHNKVYDYVRSMFAKKWGIEIDKNPKALSQPCFLFHDPGAYWDNYAECLPIRGDIELPKSRQTRKGQTAFIKKHKIDDVFGFALYHVNKKTGEYVQGNRHFHVFDLACLLNRLGVLEDETRGKVWELYPDFFEEGQDSSNAISFPYREYSDQFGSIEFSPRKAGDPTEKSEVFTRFIKEVITPHNMRYNAVSQRIEIDGEVLTDRDENSLYSEAHELGIDISIKDVGALIRGNSVPMYHPIFEFFESMDTQKHRGYIREFCDSINQTTYTREIFELLMTKWFVGAIACLYPGKKNILMPIAAGPQNVGKSYLFAECLPEALKAYSCTDDLEEEGPQKLCTHLIILVDEYENTPRRFRTLKHALSQSDFTYRKPYGRSNEKNNRIASPCGATNEDDLLSDITGNRRIIPFWVESRDFELYDSLDKARLWAEAYQLFQEGYRYELTADDISELSGQAKRFLVFSLEHDLVQKYINPIEGVAINNAGKIRIDTTKSRLSLDDVKQNHLYTAGELLEFINSASPVSGRISVNKIGKELSRLGYPQFYGRARGKVGRYYICRPIAAGV